MGVQEGINLPEAKLSWVSFLTVGLVPSRVGVVQLGDQPSWGLLLPVTEQRLRDRTQNALLVEP